MAGKQPDRVQSTIDAIRALDPSYVLNRQGKDMAMYAGLLALAHATVGVTGCRTTLLQAPADNNGGSAIVHARWEFSDGTFAEGIGDADDRNTSKLIALHKVRMAETRAKGRGLRDRLNVGGACVEELAGDEDHAAPARVAQIAPQAAQMVATAPNDAATPNLAAPATAANYARLAALHGALAKWEQGAPAPPRDGLTVAQYRAIGEALTARGKAHATAADAERAARLQGQDPKDDIPF